MERCPVLDNNTVLSKEPLKTELGLDLKQNKTHDS